MVIRLRYPHGDRRLTDEVARGQQCPEVGAAAHVAVIARSTLGYEIAMPPIVPSARALTSAVMAPSEARLITVVWKSLGDRALRTTPALLAPTSMPAA